MIAKVPIAKQIQKIKARQILDSRGNPTIEVDVNTKDSCGRAAVPSGASTGLHEALELRDNTKFYHGMAVGMAVSNVNKILAPKLKGFDVTDQASIDESMILVDGTENKSRLGANALLGVSLGVARCGANFEDKELFQYLGKPGVILPLPFANIINGGKHAGTNLRVQEFMIVPVRAQSFAQATRYVSEIYHSLKRLIELRHGKFAVNVGDEGGFSPPLSRPRETLNLIMKAISENGYQGKVRLAIDAAASEFYNWKTQQYQIEEKKLLSRGELVDYYLDLAKTFPIISIEDPFDQDDFEGFKMLTKKAKIQVIGDDLLVSNPERIKLGIQENACNSLLLKVNQIGTLSEALESARIAFKNGWRVMVSHRSGETEDTFISDLAVALKCGQIKLGAPCRGERICKYNRLLRIEEMFGGRAKLFKF